jgi:hypothetical protein
MMMIVCFDTVKVEGFFSTKAVRWRLMSGQIATYLKPTPLSSFVY